jgi:phosphoenolpyruvate---glycerone phosphotransferase subunit DhaL
VDGLTPEQLRDRFALVAQRVEESEPLLSEADRAVGDGDHGVGMARGFAAVRRELAARAPATVGDVFDVVGRTLTSSVGGASGILFGTFFRAGAAALAEHDVFDGHALRVLLAEGSAAVAKRGGASEGDKTMLDALAPAARAADGDSLASALAAAADAAERGAEETKTMVARHGKARPLGDRALGHADPGALTAAVILRVLAESG